MRDPLGLPLRMLVIGSLLKPWISMSRTLAVVPRMLADDLYIYARGINCAENLKAALNFTHAFLHDMGAAVAPKKSYVFASSNVIRDYFAS